MDPDRKSQVSSYYGGRRSGDALNDNSGNPVRPQRSRYDSASSYQNQDAGQPRPSTELLNGGTRSAGYNQNSFFDAGRTEPLKGGFDEEDPLSGKNEGSWDVFADFNNAGPRYSEAFWRPAFGLGLLIHTRDRYQPVTRGSVKPLHDDSASATGTQVEMVTVPVLGPEWKTSELHEMSRSAKKERNAEDRTKKYKQWRRGQRGLCGRWCTWRFTVFFVFGLCIAVGILLVFFIPRVPGITINQDTPLVPATGSFNSSVQTEFMTAPANFSFPAFAQLQVDTGSNFIPLQITHMNAQVFDLDTNNQVGNGDVYGLNLPAKQFVNLQMPVNFSYIANNSSDITWANWHNACKNPGQYADGQRPGLRFRLILEMNIAGLIGSRATSAQVTNANCPIELAMNAS
ncbi:hypothetical protein BJ322DRAFT_1014202 [Thelephora terrestris]|uniref:Uncharacterized protein n=1 Tax=Thelephora terrestris TaxID=56493 RepID=A0A9P6L219_9AGAM|nr:hypothetical protein BJ322DRAFT_1014202 [Thelephora terrestris]